MWRYGKVFRAVGNLPYGRKFRRWNILLVWSTKMHGG